MPRTPNNNQTKTPAKIQGEVDSEDLATAIQHNNNKSSPYTTLPNNLPEIKEKLENYVMKIMRQNNNFEFNTLQIKEDIMNRMGIVEATVKNVPMTRFLDYVNKLFKDDIIRAHSAEFKAELDRLCQDTYMPTLQQYSKNYADNVTRMDNMETNIQQLKNDVIRIDNKLVHIDEQLTKQGEQLAKQGEQQTKQGEQLTKQGEQLAKQSELLAKQDNKLSQILARFDAQSE
ncbi:Conserved_hypothetical protein [Hexamita inflata]|uniref:Uncharacterized protein n=1 Tax=Hexamita inflata TaxID=28002 RepID=A0AA86NJ22_9EUKA|nr:Conserved hypothetical protein [Hexamita inflata]